MATVTAKINPALLVWAREEAGYDVETAARKGVPKGDAERLMRWETGDESPTIPQLRRLAELYKRPLSAFYLREVPKRFRVMHDFRRLPGEVAGRFSPELLRELRLATYRRELALELTKEAGERPREIEIAIARTDDPEEAADRIRRSLGIDSSQQAKWADTRIAFNNWRNRVELLGVIVFQSIGVSTNEMRGFSIAERPFPVIVVNRGDSAAGRVFTLLHEFAHVLLRRSGLCDLVDTGRRRGLEQSVETFCNHIAGACLVPKDDLLRHEIVRERPRAQEWPNEQLDAIAGHFRVSKEVVLRRLLIFGRTTPEFYGRARDEFEREYQARKAREKGLQERPRKRNMPQETKGQLGLTYLSALFNGYRDGRLTLSELADALDIKVRHIEPLEYKLKTVG